MSHELFDNGLVLSDSYGRSLARLQPGLRYSQAFLVVVAGGHPIDTQAGILTRDDIEAIRDWCERELAADAPVVEERRLP